MEWFSNWWNGVGGLNYGILIQVLYLIAFPSLLILIIQTILLLIGMGHDGLSDVGDVGDMDLGAGDADFSVDGIDAGDMGDFGGIDAGADLGSADAGGLSAVDISDAMQTHTVHDHSAHDGDVSAKSDFGIASLFTVQGIMSFLCVFAWSGALMISGGIHPIIALPVAFLLGFAVMYGIAKFISYSRRLENSGNINVKNLLGERGTVYLKIPSKGDGKGKVMVQTSERYIEFDAVSESGEIPSDTQIRVVDILSENVLVVERDS